MAREATPHGMIQRILNRRRKRTPPTVPPPSGRPANLNFRDIGLGDIEIDPQAARGGGASPVQQAGANVSGWVGGGDAPAAEPMIQQNPPDIAREIFPRGGPAQSQQQQQQPVSAGPNQLLADQLRAAIQQRAEIANRELNTSEGKLTNLYQGMRMGARQAALGGGDLGYTLGSTIAGGIRGMFVPEEYERYKRDRDTAAASARVEGLQAEQKAMLDAQAKEQEMALKQVDLINKIGQPERERQAAAEKQRFEALKLASSRDVYNPNDPSQRAMYEAAGIDPDSVTEFDDRLMKEIFQRETQERRDEASRITDIDKFNAQKQIEVAKENTNRLMDYHNRRSNIFLNMASTIGRDGGMAAAEGAVRAMQLNAEAMQRVAQSGDIDDDARFKEIQRLSERQAQLEREFTQAMGKNAQSREALQQVQRALGEQRRPEMLKFTPLRPVQQERGPISRSALENELNSRKIRRGSPEWNRVMEAAGY